MLNKEQRQQAENMRAELVPMFAKASNLAKVWEKKAAAYRIAASIARVWQYKGEDLRYCENLPETQKKQEAQEAARTYQESRQEWHEKLYKKYQNQSATENQERAAWFNYLNYLYFICETVADKLRPYAADIFKTRGESFKQWAEIIQPKRSAEYSPKNIYISIYIDSIFSDSFCLNVETWGAGAGRCAKTYAYYKKETPTTWENKAKEPHTMTANQYAKRCAILESYQEKAKALYNEQREKAKAWGLLDACNFLKYPTTEKYR